ncbi:GNAT superfamily N-acetyltransferase [Saccharopolyspora lacisalsi]|uniref:GNAT superfamily N-acetyltransferase n=1 Tax=Halosaccharopolyspora lacisalsi TaxID=1000566 RepID=A0A839E2P5_9PSEU|nr:GNAT family N-acetyltransferase [Halosaccharopolyspora lacisalsi]MBA8825198.1 GNAT superfamily N-acetyltransferase [Halosaccharopolyspora lacisalsi]
MVDSSAARSSPIGIGPEPIDSVDARWALGSYTAELDERFQEGFDANRAAPPESGDFVPPRGVFLLVRAEGTVAGCGALRTEQDGTAEIRRMWISSTLRGRGAGRRLLWALEDHARRYGCHRVRLDTAAELDEARSLYASAGYVEIPAYNDNAYAGHWFEKSLE